MVGLLKALLIAGRETQWQHLAMRFPSSTTTKNQGEGNFIRTQVVRFEKETYAGM